MEMLFFVLVLVGFTLFRQMPEDQRRQLRLRFEYELYKRGFIEYPKP